MAKPWNGQGRGIQDMVYTDGSEPPTPATLTFTKSAAGRVLTIQQTPWPAGDAGVRVVASDGLEILSGRYAIQGGETLTFEPVNFPPGQEQRVMLLLTTAKAAAVPVAPITEHIPSKDMPTDTKATGLVEGQNS